MRDIKVNEVDKHYQVDVSDCPCASLITEIESYKYNWLINTGKEPDIIYIGWKTLLALVFQMQKDFPNLQLSDFTSFMGMGVYVVQDTWHLEVGFREPVSQIMACVKR